MKKLILFFMATLLIGCGEGKKTDTRLLGTWRLQRTKGIHTILAFRNNGSFEVDQRIEGRLSKIVEKRGKATGTYEMDESGTRLTLNTTLGDTGIDWPSGVIVYDIATLDRASLHLMDPAGKLHAWKKVRRNKTTGAGENGVATFKIAPLVVNLAESKKRSHQRYKWICAEIDLLLNEYDITAGVHPQIYEKVIFFLNSKTYGQVNTTAKISSMAKELQDVLSPYLDDRVSEVAFRNVIVTGRKEAVDRFIAQYEPKDAEKEEK